MPGEVKMRLHAEDGFGLIELLVAMIILNVGILALVASFQSGAIALARASHASTASAIADSQMELYRGLTYSQLVLDSTQLAAADNYYKCDPQVLTACSTSPEVTGTCSTFDSSACNPSRLVSNIGDKYHYRVDSYIVYDTPPNGRQLKKITIVVRDANNLNRVFARQSSAFDQTISG
jgi:Tfp pilus assembly protein PilV